MMKTCTVKRILSDVTIEVEPPNMSWMWDRTAEGKARFYEDWVREFNDFIRDHRSQDPVTLSVERQYENVCSACGHEWEPWMFEESENQGYVGKGCANCGAKLEDKEEKVAG